MTNWANQQHKYVNGSYTLIAPATDGFALPRIARNVFLSQRAKAGTTGRTMAELEWAVSFSGDILSPDLASYQIVVTVDIFHNVRVHRRGWKGDSITSPVRDAAIAKARQIVDALPEKLSNFGFSISRKGLQTYLS